MKYTTSLFALLAVALSACAGTTPTIEASKPTDGTLSCAEITEEIGEMDAIIQKAEDGKSAQLATNVGTGVGGHAVSMAGVPFLGAAISNAGGLANMSQADKEKMAEQANLRKSTLQGLSVGKGC